MSDKRRILWLLAMAVMVALIAGVPRQSAPDAGPTPREAFITACEQAPRSEYKPVRRYSCPELWEMTYGQE